MTAMKIGGFQPVTFSDFPGRMAAIVFTQGCNFRCPFCHNTGLLPQKSVSPVAEDTVISLLTRRRGRLSGVVITGGEPCLQKDLARFCEKISAMGFAVKLDTNGSRPDVIETLLAGGFVDFIAMDIKAPFERLNELTGISFPAAEIRRSIDLIARSGIDHLFRTTDVRPLLSPADLAAIKQCVPAGSPHIVQSFVAENALSASLRTKAPHVF